MAAHSVFFVSERNVMVAGCLLRRSSDKPSEAIVYLAPGGTNALDLHSGGFMGGPSVVWGIAERPWVYPLPKIDDENYVNRIGWRALMKMQQFRPEYYEVVRSAGSNDPIQGP